MGDRLSTETEIYEKRPNHVKRDLDMGKETVKRDLEYTQRDLDTWEKT